MRPFRCQRLPGKPVILVIVVPGRVPVCSWCRNSWPARQTMAWPPYTRVAWWTITVVVFCSPVAVVLAIVIWPELRGIIRTTPGGNSSRPGCSGIATISRVIPLSRCCHGRPMVAWLSGGVAWSLCVICRAMSTGWSFAACTHANRKVPVAVGVPEMLLVQVTP